MPGIRFYNAADVLAMLVEPSKFICSYRLMARAYGILTKNPQGARNLLYVLYDDEFIVL